MQTPTDTNNMDELWQLYDEQGQPIPGEGATKDEVFSKGTLHAASHVWIWRKNNGITEILLQKRAASKRTWPNLFDISTAGHIDLGETPLEAALREAKEEINLDVASHDLKLFGVHRTYLQTDGGTIENEFQWLYSLELPSASDFTLQETEVESLVWVSMEQFKTECGGDQYVPHGKFYYDMVISAIESTAQ